VDVRDAMTAPALAVRPETPLKDVARLFIEKGISGVPVTDAGGRVLGIVSEADFLLREQGNAPRKRGTWRPLAWLLGGEQSSAMQAKIHATTAGQAMTSPAITIEASRPLREAASRMVEAAVNRLPVEDDGKLVGILTRADLVRAYLRPDAELEAFIEDDVIRDTLWLEPGSVEVSVREGVVTLEGTVDRRSTSTILAKLVGQVDGVLGVEDKLAWELDDRDLPAAPERGEPETTAASITARERHRPIG
jgi:CBS domain-containing protein